MTRRRVVRDQRGFTLVELLVSMTVGLVVLAAAFALAVASERTARKVSDRVDATQRGRLAMEQMTQALRSQVCLGPGKPAFVEGEDSKVTFYTEVRTHTFTGPQFVPEMRRLTYVPPAGTTPGRIVEDRWTGTGTPPNVTFPATPTKSRVLIENVRTIKPTAADPSPTIFRFYKYDPIPGTGFDKLNTPLVAADYGAVSQVDIRFEALPTAKAAYSRASSELATSVYTRLADPRYPTQGTQCA